MNEDSHSRRTYDSSLRVQQQEMTRDCIMRAVQSLVLDGHMHDFTIQEVVNKAGVSYATVYRHFSSREAVLEGLVHWGLERTLRIIPPYPSRLEDLPDWVERTVRVLIPHLQTAKILEAVRSAMDRKQVPQPSRERDELFARLVKQAAPGLSETYQKVATANLRIWGSIRTWAELYVRYGLDEKAVILAAYQGMKAQVDSIKMLAAESEKE